MKSIALAFLSTLTLATAAEPTSPPVTLTFWVSGVECVSCVDVIVRSVTELKGVKDVALTQMIDSYANISFDPKEVGVQEIAQAIYEAPGLHGRPYEPTLHLTVPDYAKGDMAVKLDALLAKQKSWIKADLIDKAKGEFILRFEQLEEEDKPGAQGWKFFEFAKALQAIAPASAMKDEGKRLKLFFQNPAEETK